MNKTFMQGVEDSMNRQAKLGETENGAVGFKTTDSALLDLNFKATSLRGASADTVWQLFNAAFQENPSLAMRWLFFARDIRGGLGERTLFRLILSSMAVHGDIEMIQKVLKLVPEYGRWDDLLCLMTTPVEKEALDLIKTQLTDDWKAHLSNKPNVSLLAKWLPSVNTSSKVSRVLGRKIAAHCGLNEQRYRQILSTLRKKIDIVERKMSASKWGDIEYSHVPSQASIRYRAAFRKHDAERYAKYICDVNSGEKKINASTLFPHDIVRQYRDNHWGLSDGQEVKPELEALWNNLPNTVAEGANMLVIRDGSGSMTSFVPNSTTSCLDCSTALAIYFAEHMRGEFKNKFITFSSRPKLIDLNGCESLRDKLVRCYKEDDCTNTNLYAVFEMILKVAVDNKLSQGELPSSLLILSDMEFDECCRSAYNETLIECIQKRYEEAGYNVPRLVFWNLCSRSGIIPVTSNKLGVALVSGFSPHLAKMVLSGELDPYKVMVETLNGERYAPVEAAIS